MNTESRIQRWDQLNSRRIGLPTLKLFLCATAMEADQMDYPNRMDHLKVLRERIGRLRVEIAQIQELNKQYRLRDSIGPEARVAHVQRQERLQAIQQELVQLASLGPKVLSVEEMKEKHRSRLHLVKKAS